MRFKQFAFLLLFAFYSHSLQGEENNKSKDLSNDNNIQNTLKSKNPREIIIHVVKKGDTLSSISKKYAITKESIIKVNKLKNENYIFVGQNLRIVENLITENDNKTVYHVIKKGDNLTEIANKYNLSLSKLVEINGIENLNMLEVGTKLKLIEEISTNQVYPNNESKDLIEIDKLTKNNYGPLLIEYDKRNIEKNTKKFLKATHKNGKKFILQINCEKKEINVRGIGRKWKGWMPAREGFEDELINDCCREFD